MFSRGRFWLLLAVALLAALMIALAQIFTPEDSNPAFAAAADFMRAAGSGDDAVAFALLEAAMQAYVQENCPAASVSACVADFIPAEWGAFQSAVFRRAAPDGDAWDVTLIATYAEGLGFSGVCIYHRMEQVAQNDWRVAGWAGFISCGEGAARSLSTDPAAPNRAP